MKISTTLRMLGVAALAALALLVSTGTAFEARSGQTGVQAADIEWPGGPKY
ncbi:hypothetical protein [Kitasatospora purpeofusca]|uniref:Uncharacterized protein n=1 Tax=Kitasatospora purpeofusca TaxID=67352 RepID=A0ABZ1U5K7_9ACTN|nr:hypothetical protein [Kitasatospora purpeofusca]